MKFGTLVEMSIVFVSSPQQNNTRSPWFQTLLNEMLTHLERRRKDKECRCAWLEFIEPLLNAAGSGLANLPSAGRSRSVEGSSVDGGSGDNTLPMKTRGNLLIMQIQQFLIVIPGNNCGSR
ncbi:hypothetical protein MLD38_018903 [Melastoma candidum]|uniref:Uncharacterized protein n=1 Tax=Melastoma candidum TaxID=119954 RepID=A0ACB9QV74_9MYRT|nr:hypothetical protein MLD38_018903 [Melastoma candidum]